MTNLNSVFKSQRHYFANKVRLGKAMVFPVVMCGCEGWTVKKAPLSIGFFRQEYWSGLPFPPPGDLPDPGTEPRSLSL